MSYYTLPWLTLYHLTLSLKDLPYLKFCIKRLTIPKITLPYISHLAVLYLPLSSLAYLPDLMHHLAITYQTLPSLS